MRRIQDRIVETMETTMAALKSLTFTATPRSYFDDPLLVRRAKLMARLEEQKALFKDPLFVAVEQRWDKTAGGRKELVERKRKVRRWWREDVTGNVFLTVRYGQKTIEFDKGKTAISVGSKDKIPQVLDVLIAAVKAGELDEALTAMSKARGAFRRKAA